MIGYNYSNSDTLSIWAIGLPQILGAADLNVTSRLTAFPDPKNDHVKVRYTLSLSWVCYCRILIGAYNYTNVDRTTSNWYMALNEILGASDLNVTSRLASFRDFKDESKRVGAINCHSNAILYAALTVLILAYELYIFVTTGIRIL